MAERKEILSDLSSKIAEGNIREAYRTFEDLPVVDQIAVSISPGVGDALAAYEVGEFGARAKTNIEDKDYLGAAGNYAMSGLSLASLIPLLRFLRGARGVTKSASKTVDAPTTPDKPLTEEPLQLSPPKKVEPELPEVEEIFPFQQKSIKELSYDTQQPALPLSSKARNFLHGHYKKLDPKTQTLPLDDWIKTLTNPNNEIPLGELRLLNVLDEMNEVHPKLKLQAGQFKDSKISKGFLDNYMAENQIDSLIVRGVPPGRLESPDTSFDNDAVKRSQQQKLYFVRGGGDKRTRKDHYAGLQLDNPNLGKKLINEPQKTTGDKTYVFDGVGTYKPLDRLQSAIGVDSQKSFDEINEALKDIGVTPDDTFVDIFRVQSDFADEVGRSTNFVNPKTQKEITKKLLRYNKIADELNPFLATNPNKRQNAVLIRDVLDDVYDLPVRGLEFNLDADDVTKYTGKSFTESLDKTPEEIFYTPDGSGGLKYFEVPNNPEALSKAYFEDTTMNTRGFQDLQGPSGEFTILKQAVIPKLTDIGSGKYLIDPYFGKSSTNEMKLPIRTNMLQAYKQGADGIHISDRQAKTEGSGGYKNVLEKYTRGEKEIQKILDELGLGNKKKQILTKIEGTDTQYDGTYLKFTDEVKKAIEEKGINAFKDGGPVEIDRMLAEL